MKLQSLLTLAFFSAALIGCTPLNMSVSDDLKVNANEYAVKGRQGILIKQKLSFGEYNTTKVKRSWLRSTSSQDAIAWGDNGKGGWVHMIALEYIDKKQTLNFSLSDAQNTSEAYCVSKFNA